MNLRKKIKIKIKKKGNEKKNREGAIEKEKKREASMII